VARAALSLSLSLPIQRTKGSKTMPRVWCRFFIGGVPCWYVPVSSKSVSQSISQSAVSGKKGFAR